MADISIDAFWIGSNAQFASQLSFEVGPDSQQNAVRFQQVIAGIIAANFDKVKVCLGAPNGPELTPVLATVQTWKHLLYYGVRKPVTSEAQQNMLEAWTFLLQQTKNQAKPASARVFVTLHGVADLAVARLLYVYDHWYKHSYDGLNEYHAARKLLALHSFMSKKLRKNPKVAFVAVTAAQSINENLTVPEELRSDKRFILSLLDNYITCGKELQIADLKLKSDKALVVACTRANPHNFRHAAQHLRDDKEVFSVAFDLDPRQIQYAGPSVVGDKATVLVCINKWPNSYKYASKPLKGDMDVAIAAVSNDGGLLSEASLKLRDNKTVVLAAVANKGCALKHASETLRGNKDVVLAAVLNDGEAILYMDPALQDDEQIARAASAYLRTHSAQFIAQCRQQYFTKSTGT